MHAEAFDMFLPDPASESLETQLLPLVRRAIRNQVGLPGLTNWVRRSLVALGDGPPRDPDRTVAGLTKLLCETLRHAGAADRPVRETVLGP